MASAIAQGATNPNSASALRCGDGARPETIPDSRSPACVSSGSLIHFPHRPERPGSLASQPTLALLVVALRRLLVGVAIAEPPFDRECVPDQRERGEGQAARGPRGP